MQIESTPHITLRKANGLINIDYTACDILGINDDDSRPAAARSYSTIIGVYTKDQDGRKVYLETSGVYSTTTAAKHKPRAAILATYNGFKIVSGINPDVLFNLYFYPSKAPVLDEILKEAETRNQLIKELKANKHISFLITDLLVRDVITARREPESTPYKNGNRLTKHYYKTNFKYVSNITYEVQRRDILTTTRTRSGKATYHRQQYNIRNIRE